MLDFAAIGLFFLFGLAGKGTGNGAEDVEVQLVYKSDSELLISKEGKSYTGTGTRARTLLFLLARVLGLTRGIGSDLLVFCWLLGDC